MSVATEITSKGLELTQLMKDRVESKIGKVISKLGTRAISSHVVVKVNRMPATGTHSKVKLNAVLLMTKLSFKY